MSFTCSPWPSPQAIVGALMDWAMTYSNVQETQS